MQQENVLKEETPSKAVDRQSPNFVQRDIGVAPADLGALAIADPHKAVAFDVAALKANPLLPGEFLVIGLVYDVTTGRIEIVVPPSLLRPEKPA